MELKEEAGKLDILVFILVLLGTAYFLTTGYPLYLADKFPVLDGVVPRIVASLFIAIGGLYLLYVVVSSFLFSVRRLDTVLSGQEEEKKED